MNNTYYQRPSNSGKNSGKSNLQQVNRPQSSVKDLVANGVLVLLSIILVISLFTMFDELSRIDRHYEKDANSFWWNYDSGRYADSIKHKYENMFSGVKETAELKQCYAVADYYEAVSLYKMAVHTGNDAKEKKFKEAMEKAYSELGDVSYLAEEIRAKFGITDIVE